MFLAAVRSVQSGLGYALVGRAWIGKQVSALRTKQTTLSGHAPTLRVALQGFVQPISDLLSNVCTTSVEVKNHFLHTRETTYFISPSAQSTPSSNTLCAAVTVLLLYLLGQLHNVLKVHVMQ